MGHELVGIHVCSEVNVMADALSRVGERGVIASRAAPVAQERNVVPQRTLGVDLPQIFGRTCCDLSGENGGLAGSPRKAHSCMLVLRGGPAAHVCSPRVDLSAGEHSSGLFCCHGGSLSECDSSAWIGFRWQGHASHDNFEANPCHRQQCRFGPIYSCKAQYTDRNATGWCPNSCKSGGKQSRWSRWNKGAGLTCHGDVH